MSPAFSFNTACVFTVYRNLSMPIFLYLSYFSPRRECEPGSDRFISTHQAAEFSESFFTTRFTNFLSESSFISYMQRCIYWTPKIELQSVRLIIFFAHTLSAVWPHCLPNPHLSQSGLSPSDQIQEHSENKIQSHFKAFIFHNV